MTTGEKIKRFRVLKGLKQAELAKMAGVSRVAIGNYERGDRIPNIEIARKIAEALDVSISEIIATPSENDRQIIGQRVDYVFNNKQEINSLKNIINALDFNTFENSLQDFPEDLKSSVFELWSAYLGRIMKWWYYEKEKVYCPDIDLLYVQYAILNSTQNFYNHLIEMRLDPSHTKIRKAEVKDFDCVFVNKTELLNTISTYIDKITNLGLKIGRAHV